MDIVTIVEASFIALLTIIGAILVTVGYQRNGIKRLLSGGSLLAIAFIETLLDPLNSAMRDALSAISGFSLVIFAAFTLIMNFRIRKDAQEREERDKKERLLNEIIEWATNACELALIESISNPSQLTGIKATNFLLDRTQEVERFRLLRARSVYAGKIAMKYPKLKQVVEDLTNKIREQIQLLFQFKEQMPKEEKDLHKAAKKAFLNNEKIYNAAIEVIEKTSDLV